MLFKNKKASHEYFFLDKLEVGIALTGTEIKSIREGKLNFKDSYATIKDDGVWLINLHISPYEKGSYSNHEPTRKRRLLLHKREIKKLTKKIEEQGLTLVPMNLYINDSGRAKLTLAVAKGKKNYDKRDTIQKRDQERDLQRKFKMN